MQGGENEEKQPPIIGHISMLTDITCTPQYVITCDTDERVRVSDVTKPHVIQSFCLGHHEFVHKLVPVEGGNLVTTSGDGSVKMWKLVYCICLNVVVICNSLKVLYSVLEKEGVIK